MYTTLRPSLLADAVRFLFDALIRMNQAEASVGDLLLVHKLQAHKLINYNLTNERNKARFR